MPIREARKTDGNIKMGASVKKRMLQEMRHPPRDKDSKESPNEKKRVDEFINEWCRLYRETSQASHDNHEESR